MPTRNTLKERYQSVMDRVAAAAVRSGRSPEKMMVVAVTKTASPQQIRQLVEMGHRDLGENRVQQLQQREAVIGEAAARRKLVGGGVGEKSGESGVRWHMIGHLQRNKVRAVLPIVRLIHSVDSLRLAEEIQTQAARLDVEGDVLLEVNASGESSKFGLSIPAVAHVAEQMQSMANVRVRGLMTMAPESADPEASRETFERCAELFEEVKSSGRAGSQFNLLSMGMSNDFEVAVSCGANLLRIGRAIFGDAPTET